ncbi:MFS transporter [Nocardioides sp.]|uniref:MFS transporter n=1 Tax=Nocardioides sp. TaxID=35761 RepID=UPI002ED38620
MTSQTSVVRPERRAEASGSRSPWALGSAGIAMVGVAYGFARYGYGLFEPQLREAFGLSITASGVIAGGACLGYVLALVSVGLLARRVGPRPLVTAAGLTAVAGTALVAVAQQPWQLCAGLVVAGTSAGFAWAPYSDAVDHLVLPARRDTVLAAIASGTAFGIVVAGGLALVSMDAGWRWAWALFCAIAVLTTAYNWRLLRDTTSHTLQGRDVPRLSVRFFLRPGTRSLYVTGLSYGVVGAVYWTFAVSAISQASAAPALAAPAFWTLIGVAGTAAVLTGRLLARVGLPRSHTLLIGGIGTATSLLGVAPGSWLAVGLSAVAFGACFMGTSGLLAVWSHGVFPDRPAEGLSAMLLFLGLGATAGPPVFGVLAAAWDFRTALLITAVVAFASLGLRPALDPDRP